MAMLIIITIASFLSTLHVSASSITPPDGNVIFLSFFGKGVQIYQCLLQPDDGFKYVFLRSQAGLFQSAHDSRAQIRGYHYFLQHPDGEGGTPTFSLLDSPGDNATVIPSSTATFKVFDQNPANDWAKNVADLLLQATSHSGNGPLSMASYAQLIHSSGGAAPSTCSLDAAGSVLKVHYQAQYRFWTPANIPPSTTPPSIQVAQTPLVYFFGQGFQIYKFNGTSWALSNVSADLSALPGSPALGKHYLLAAKDAKGGIATWELFSPQGQVTAIISNRVQKDPNNVPWLLANATSHAGNSCILSNVVYVQRLSTVGGIPPASIAGAKLGDMHQSPYTAIYSFY